MPLVRAYIALGSNLGDRLEQMQSALQLLAVDDVLKVLQVSPVYENRAVGMGDVDDFLNAIVEVDTSLAPLDLLDRCLDVESQLGRVRTGEWAPRTIDLDVIAYGDDVIESERLQLPHPRIAERDFVVHPLKAIAPELRIGGMKVCELAEHLPMDALTLHDHSLRVTSDLQTMKPSVEIEYCPGCRWLLRAGWTAQELLTTFEAELGAVTLRPAEVGGTFRVSVDGDLLWDRKIEGRFPEMKELKQGLRDQIAPTRDLGHSDTEERQSNGR